MKEKYGKVTIAPNVLLTIVRLTTLSVPGVSRMSGSLTSEMNRFLGRSHFDRGIRIEVQDDVVSVDLHIIVKPDINLLKLGRTIQSEVTRAINDMVGMRVDQVNVHIDNVDVELTT